MNGPLKPNEEKKESKEEKRKDAKQEEKKDEKKNLSGGVSGQGGGMLKVNCAECAHVHECVPACVATPTCRLEALNECISFLFEFIFLVSFH